LTLTDRAVRVEQLGQPDAVCATREILAIAEQEPATALDDLARRLVALRPVGFVDADAVDHLPRVLGDDVEQIEDDLGVGQCALTSKMNGVCMSIAMARIRPQRVVPSRSKNDLLATALADLIRLDPLPAFERRIEPAVAWRAEGSRVIDGYGAATSGSAGGEARRSDRVVGRALRGSARASVAVALGRSIALVLAAHGSQARSSRTICVPRPPGSAIHLSLPLRRRAGGLR
jgi:hypothetical protein